MLRGVRMSMENKKIIVEKSIEWWKSIRPVGWSNKKHLKSPSVNTTNDAEKNLALAIANYLQAQMEESK